MSLTSFAVFVLVATLGLQMRLACQDDSPPSRPAAENPDLTALLARIDKTRGTPKSDPPLSLRVEGTYTVVIDGAAGGQPVAKGAFRESFVGTDQARHTSEMGPMGALERGLVGDLAWEVDPAMGAKIHRGANAAVVRRFFAVLRGDSPRKLYQSFEWLHAEAIDGREHRAVRMVAAEGPPDIWFVDADGVVSRVEMYLPAPESADATFAIDDGMRARIGFADWKDVDGVQRAYTRTIRMGYATVSMTCTKITSPAKIEAKTFAPPAAIEKLEPAATGPAFGADGKTNYQIIAREAQPVASIRIKCKPSEISTQLAVLLPEIMAHLNASGAAMAGAPYSRYHAFGPDEMDLEAGIPVREAIPEKGRIKNGTLPAGRTVTCWHIGPYHDLSKAHAALQAHMNSEKLVARGGPWEVYWTDPGMVPDSSKWRTQIFAPIE